MLRVRPASVAETEELERPGGGCRGSFYRMLNAIKICLMARSTNGAVLQIQAHFFSANDRRPRYIRDRVYSNGLRPKLREDAAG